jgi:hypothetical protein
MAERQERGYNIWGKIGSGLSVLPAWMFEFAMTAGLYKLGSAPVKKLLQNHMKTKLIAKTAGWISGSVVRTTVGMPHRVFANTMQQSLDNDEGWATSIAKGWGETMIEVASESAGEGIVGGAKWVTVGVVNKLPFGKKFLSALQKAWTKLSPDNTAAKFAKRISTKGGYNGLIGEFGEERLASLMHAVAGTDTFGLPKGASIEDRLVAAVKQDLEMSNLVAEAAVLSVPGSIKVSIAHLGRFASNRKLAKAIQEQVGVSAEAAANAVVIKKKEGIEAADKYLSQVKTESQAAADLEQALDEDARKAAEALAKPEPTPTTPKEEIAAPAETKAPSEVGEKKPWEMTREEFNAEYERSFDELTPEQQEQALSIVRKEGYPARGVDDAGVRDIAEGRIWNTWKGIQMGDFSTQRDNLKVTGSAHEQAVRSEVVNNRPVPRHVLEEYKSEKWAQEALAKAPSEVAKEGFEPSGGVPVETRDILGGVDPILEINKALREAVEIRPKVEKERKVEVRKRVAAAAGTLKSLLAKRKLSAEESIGRSTGLLKGPLSDARFSSIRDVMEDAAPGAVDEAFRSIGESEKLRYFEIIETKEAFAKLIDGIPITLAPG